VDGHHIQVQPVLHRLALGYIWHESDIAGTHAEGKLDEVRTAFVRLRAAG
jgi:hypothetical protein